MAVTDERNDVVLLRHENQSRLVSPRVVELADQGLKIFQEVTLCSWTSHVVGKVNQSVVDVAPIDTEKELHTVTSLDGTEIGYWVTGEGPPIVLVNGPFGDHTRWDTLVPHLEPQVTVHAIDRSGRGASEDHPEWRIEREYEDVAAVVDAVADSTGAPVTVYGQSGGGIYAFGAVPLTANVGQLVLYEGWPPMGPDIISPPTALVEEMQRLLEEDDRDALLELVFRKLVGSTEDELEHLKSQPSWQARVEAAHTGVRELRALAERSWNPEEALRITVPTLLLVGDTDPHPIADEAEAVVNTLPDARIAVLEGQAHEADITAPELVAEVIVEFVDQTG